jgi:arsenate reductase
MPDDNTTIILGMVCADQYYTPLSSIRETTMSVTIYHNPRCSKSRQTLQLLRDKGIEPNIVEYLSTPPSPAELADILDRLGLEPRDLMRKKEAEYGEAGLDNPELSREELIQRMVDYPKVIERPIVLKDNKAAIGRPPENVLGIL